MLLLLTGVGPVASYLDASLSSVVRVYGFRKAFAAYAGPCIRVRRSSDNAEQDIGFTANGYIDAASLLAFCGGGNGFVKTWYDHGLAGLNATQSTTTSQPMIVSSGVLVQNDGYTGCLSFDGGDVLLTSNYDLSATNKASMLVGVGNIGSIGGDSAIAYSSGAIANAGIGILTGSIGSFRPSLFGGSGTYEIWNQTATESGRKLIGLKADKSLGSLSKVTAFWNNTYSNTGFTNLFDTATSVGNLSSNPISIGADSSIATPSTAKIDFVMFADRLLTESEMQSVSTFANRSSILIGDSTSAIYSGQIAVASAVYGESDRFRGNPIESIAVSGHTIAQQKTAWQANGQRKSVAWVSIQVGLNNMDPGSSSTAATIAAYQDLVDTIRADNATCKIIGLTMTPAYERWAGIGWDQTLAQARWVALNDAIMGRGASPITGLDAKTETHTTALTTLVSGNAALAPAYDLGDHIHPNTAGRTINATSIRTALSALGLV